MSTTIKVRTPAELKKAYTRIAKGIASPFKSTRRMFVMLGVMIDRDTQLTFKGEGNYLDRPGWVAFGKGAGVQSYWMGSKFAKRPGTDNAKTRRYSPTSKLLQASGDFKRSFKILNVGSKKMTYGTRHRLAGKIGTNPTRQVLHYTNQDVRRYTDVVVRWWSKGMKF